MKQRWRQDRRTLWGWTCGGALGALLTVGVGAGLAQTDPTALPPNVSPPAAAAPANDKGVKDGAPKDAAPKDAAPKDAAPKDAAPKDAAPKDAAPKDAAPKDAAPKGAAPKDAAALPPVIVEQGKGCTVCASDEKAACDGKDDGPKSVFSSVPPVFAQAIPRPGFFFMPPKGPGYYSFWDVVKDKYREDRPPQPYGPVSIMLWSFFDADYRYLDKPDAEYQSPSDALKRMHVGDNWMLSIGGEERVRFVNDVNGRLTGGNNNFQLSRTRLYADLWYEDKVRVYVEGIDAERFNGNLPPLATDLNHGDLLNAFVDVKLAELDGAPVYARAGRQEMYYGSQRLISALDWANDRRTFQGVKAFRHSEDFDADVFWVQPVLPNPTRFDSVDDKQNFSGAWLTYRPKKGQAIDLYYLNLDNANHNVLGQKGVPGSFNVSTIGTRYAGNRENVLFDFEGMYQFGSWSNQNISAAAGTAALGYNFCQLPMTPQFWVSWDYASGDQNPGATGTHNTFDQLFPFGHYYNFLDLVGRQNIRDLQMQFSVWPAKWITCYAQYHIFNLDSAKDALYNSAGVAIRRDPTGKDGTDVGNELDLVTNFHLSQNQDVFIGYSKLYEGSFLKKTGPGPSPELFYVQYSIRF